MRHSGGFQKRVMPDSDRWQSGVCGCFSGGVNGKVLIILRLFRRICRDIPAFKNRLPFPTVIILINCRNPIKNAVMCLCGWLWRVALAFAIISSFVFISPLILIFCRSPFFHFRPSSLKKTTILAFLYCFKHW